MPDPTIDPSLLQDFLTESAELIEQLDANLVTLESVAGTHAGADLLNAIFRGLHTIKGAASFLGLTTVTTFAHAAEDALNRLRKGEVRVTPPVMDAMLKSVDVIRGMIDELNSGDEVTPGPEALIQRLHAIAAGQVDAAEPLVPPASSAPPAAAAIAAIATDSQSATLASASAEPTADSTASSGPASAGAMQEVELKLPPQKADLLEFMVADLRDSVAQIDQCLREAGNDATRCDAAHHLTQIGDALARTAEFFELPSLSTLVSLLQQAAPRLADERSQAPADLLLRLAAVKRLIVSHADALDRGRQLVLPIQTLAERVLMLVEGRSLPAEVAGRAADVTGVLVIDGVAVPPAPVASVVALPAPSAPSTPAVPTVADPAAGPAPTGESIDRKSSTAAAGGASLPTGATVAEQTIRVEVERLEALLNLVGQLVLTKNRMLALSRKLRDHDVPVELTQHFTGASGDLDRLTGELQVGVMRTRMQPLAKLFDRYPRVIRDIARASQKKIHLEVVGKETEVDKSVLELLADPLVHILRNSADHGVEPPEKRTAAGKPETGTVRLVAEHQGSHVRVAITDDGKGLDREVLGRKAVERGMVTAEQLTGMSDSEVFQFIFAPGFSTAERVTDLSGRGVGMDVVRTNITRMNGTINLFSTKGQGTTVEILIPLTVAIMPAMVVGVGRHLYCVPLQTIVEIVRPEEAAVHSVSGQPVMRLRDSVLPLIDLRARLNESGEGAGGKFSVVVSVGGQRAGLMVDRLIGQSEIVIKPLDDKYTQGGPFSGATIREDGDVSLILDVVQLIRQAQAAGERRAAA